MYKAPTRFIWVKRNIHILRMSLRPSNQKVDFGDKTDVYIRSVFRTQDGIKCAIKTIYIGNTELMTLNQKSFLCLFSGNLSTFQIPVHCLQTWEWKMRRWFSKTLISWSAELRCSVALPWVAFGKLAWSLSLVLVLFMGLYCRQRFDVAWTWPQWTPESCVATHFSKALPMGDITVAPPIFCSVFLQIESLKWNSWFHICVRLVNN